MRARLIFIFFLLLGISAFGQKFNSGYIVYNNGEKVFGLIKVNPLKENPDKLLFKKNETSRPEVIKLSELKEYSYNDRQFIKAFVKVDLSGNKKFSHVKSYDEFFSKDTLFLQVVFNGPKALYWGYYNNKDLFYIRRQDSIVLLEAPWVITRDSVMDPALNRLMNRYNYQIQTKVSGETRITVIETYKFQLSVYLSDYPGINSAINTTTYNFYSLYNLFHKYYNETGRKPAYSYILPYEIADIGFFAGKTFQNTDISGENNMFFYLSTPKFVSIPSDYFGIYAQNTFWQTNYRFSLYSSLAYRNFHVIGAGTGKTNYYDYVYTYTELNISFLELKFLMKYNAILKPVRVSVFFGGGYSFPLFENSPVYEYGLHRDQKVFKKYDALIPQYQGDKYYTQEAAAYAGISVSKGRLGLDITLARTNGFLSPMRLMQHNSILAVTLTYSVFKIK